MLRAGNGDFTMPQDAISPRSVTGPHWRGWGKPARPDLNFYGVDLHEGEHRALYAGWETIDLDRQLPGFPGARLNAFLATHLIEHLAEPERLIRWIAERGEPGARIYL